MNQATPTPKRRLWVLLVVMTSLPVLILLSWSLIQEDHSIRIVESEPEQLECKDGTFESQGTCIAELSYGEMVYGLTTDVPYPIRIQGDSCDTLTVVEAQNETSYQSGDIPHSYSWLYTEVLPSGRILASARMTSDGGNRHMMIIDPITNTLRDYDGEEGVFPDMGQPDGGWFMVTPADHPEYGVGVYARMGSMLIYADRYDQRYLYCREDGASPQELTHELGGFIGLKTYVHEER